MGKADVLNREWERAEELLAAGDAMLSTRDLAWRWGVTPGAITAAARQGKYGALRYGGRWAFPLSAVRAHERGAARSGGVKEFRAGRRRPRREARWLLTPHALALTLERVLYCDVAEQAGWPEGVLVMVTEIAESIGVETAEAARPRAYSPWGWCEGCGASSPTGHHPACEAVNGEARWLTPSDSRDGVTHVTVLRRDGVRCSCPGFRFRSECRHARALEARWPHGLPQPPRVRAALAG